MQSGPVWQVERRAVGQRAAVAVDEDQPDRDVEHGEATPVTARRTSAFASTRPRGRQRSDRTLA